MENNEINENIDAHNEDNKVLKNPKRGRVFVRNLPFNVTEELLKEYFSKHGEITEVNFN